MDLYPYQNLVKSHLQNGQSVLLQAPTGAGKTLAALAPFIDAYFSFPAERFPKKCIYSVPMRVLATQFEREYRTLAERYERRHNRAINVTIQTGERPEDSKLEGDLIFTTIDQTLSNFLCIPHALSNGQANINAGAIASAYLVFDEFHLYPPQAIETTLHILSMLKGYVPFLLMTATFSTPMLAALKDKLGAVVVPEDEIHQQRMQNLPSQQKTRYYHTVDNVMTADAVLEKHPSSGRSLVVCNTVARAQAIFDQLSQQSTVRVELIHSRFYKRHRQEKETWLAREFGKNKTKYSEESAIVVATQVVEVGLDITADVLHTELAPANAILQRAGRCARYPGEVGHIYIYRLPTNEKTGKPVYHPYHDREQSKICERTWTAFEQVQNQCVDFVGEHQILEQTHGPNDKQQVTQQADNRHHHSVLMARAMGIQDRGTIRDLIRDVNSCNIIVHPNPNDDMDERYPEQIKNPWLWESFSLFRGSVYGAFSHIQTLAEEIDHEDWLMMILEQHEDPEAIGPGQVIYNWRPVHDISELAGAILVAVHPRFAHYSETYGLQLGKLNDIPWQVEQRAFTPKRTDDRYTYQLENYQTHIAGLWHAYNKPTLLWNRTSRNTTQRQALQTDMAYVFTKIENKLGISLDQAARLIIAGHDLGKLNRRWQQWARSWQEMINKPVDQTFLVAHTDYDDSTQHRTLQKTLKNRLQKPPHAAESAYGLARIIVGRNQNPEHLALAKAMITAIVRHHSATHQGKVTDFELDAAATEGLQAAFDIVGYGTVDLDQLQSKFGENAELVNRLVDADKTDQMILYLLLARVLRLADQRSQQIH